MRDTGARGRSGHAPRIPRSAPDTRCPADLRLGRAGGFQVARATRRRAGGGDVRVRGQAREGAVGARRRHGRGRGQEREAGRGGHPPARRREREGRAHAHRQAEGLEDGGRGARRRQGAVLPGPRQAAGQAPEGPGGREGPRRRARREAVREARAGQRRRDPHASSASAPRPLRPPRRRRAAGPASGGRLQPPAPRSTPTPTAPAGKACANGADDDNDGQTDLEDPGCADGNDTSEDSEVTVPAACSENSGIGMGDDPTWLGAGINDCGPFTKDPHRRRPGDRQLRRSSPAGRNGRARPRHRHRRGRSTRRT